MSERLDVETPFGSVWLRGRITGRPAVVWLHGAFADLDLHHRATVAGADVVHLHLPGNHCPELIATSLGVWGRAYAAAIGQVLANRPIGVIGASTGALIALALRLPQIQRMVLIEPPLRPHLAWPFRALPQQYPHASEMIWNIFGVAPNRIEERDYGHLLDDLVAPSIALVGDLKLGVERPLETMPSLVDPVTRAQLDAHPAIEVREVKGVGHNIPRDGMPDLVRAVRDLRQAILSPGALRDEPG